MLTENEIKRAVELVELSPIPAHFLTFKEKKQWALDALAAALVRVVDKGIATDKEFFGMELYPMSSIVMKYYDGVASNPVAIGNGPDRTENTIKAVLQLAEKYPELFTQL